MDIMLNSASIIEINGNLGEYKADIFTNSLSHNTQKAYVRDILDFFEVDKLENISLYQVQSVNVSSANQFRQALTNKGYATSTINRKLTAMSKFYSYLCRKEIGLMDYNPFSSKEGMLRLREDKKYSNTRCLIENEVKALIKVTMVGNDILSMRNRIIIFLLATTGMRRSEIVSIKIGAIKTTMGKVVIELTKAKGDKPRLIVVSKAIKEMIDKYIQMRGLSYSNTNAYLLGNHTSNASQYEDKISDHTIYVIIKSIAKKSGIDPEHITPHCLRHTWVTEAIEAGCLIQDIADMAGHSSISTTKRYDHTNRVVSHNPADMLTDKFMS